MSTYTRAEVEAMLVEAVTRSLTDRRRSPAAIAARILAAKAPEGARAIEYAEERGRVKALATAPRCTNCGGCLSEAALRARERGGR